MMLCCEGAFLQTPGDSSQRFQNWLESATGHEDEKLFCNSAVHGPMWPKNHMFDKTTNPKKFTFKVGVKTMAPPKA